MNRGGALAALALAGLAACRRAEPPADTPRSGLERTVNRVHETPPCSRVIPEHWSPSVPVPALEDGRLIYKMFFFGRDGTKREGFTFYRAQGFAAFTPDGAVLDCRVPGGPRIAIPRPPKLELALNELAERERRLYGLIERLAEVYASRREPDAAETGAIAGLLGGYGPWFDAHAADYRALSPGFWAWIEKNGGKAP